MASTRPSPARSTCAGIRHSRVPSTVALSESRRLELAERYYGTALTLWPNLERYFAHAQHPLAGDALGAAKAALILATELATAYKHLLAHEAEKRILLSGNRLLVALTALGRSSQLPQHLRASLKAGLSPDQLREAIMLTATIAGFPPAMNAMATFKSVLADRDRSAGREDPAEDRA